MNNNFDVRAHLGNPKITFAIGGPHSGRTQYCKRLAEEFDYKLIDMASLLKTEMVKVSIRYSNSSGHERQRRNQEKPEGPLPRFR